MKNISFEVRSTGKSDDQKIIQSLGELLGVFWVEVNTSRVDAICGDDMPEESLKNIVRQQGIEVY